MGREVEKGILGYIIKEAKKSDVEKIKGQFIPSKKNKPIENFLPNCGFRKEGEYWIYSLNSTFTVPDYLTVSAQ
jgi:predicted enzyme involved in methoxymalonyl-ACP biosynthesis